MDDMVCLHEMYAWALVVGFNIWVFLTIIGFMYMINVIEVTQQQVDHLKFELEHNVIRVNQSRSTTEVSSNDESEDETEDAPNSGVSDDHEYHFDDISNDVQSSQKSPTPIKVTRTGILQRLVSGWGGEPIDIPDKTAQDIIQSSHEDNDKTKNE